MSKRSIPKDQLYVIFPKGWKRTPKSTFKSKPRIAASTTKEPLPKTQERNKNV